MYERTQILLAEENKNRQNRRENTAIAFRLKPKNDMLKNGIAGNMESTNYKDSLREMFGIHAYIAFTLDRVRIIFLCSILFSILLVNFCLCHFQMISNAVRQLQHCVTKRGATECVEPFHQETKRGVTGRLCRPVNKRIQAIHQRTCLLVERLPIMQYLAEKMAALCYERPWYAKMGGCIALEFLYKHMAMRWLYQHLFMFLKAFMFVLMDLTGGSVKWSH